VQRPGAWARDARPPRNALAASLLLFAVGGALGMAISGLNTVIPAHYHGSIVGVTLALMGLTYHLLPRLGFAPPPPRLAAWQPWVYATGQLLHVGGLAVSGAMGIQRKTAGAAQGLDTLGAKAAMGVMGLGGLLAVIGGILFVVAVIVAVRRRFRV
jgi:heme/copper-type cytochrome/quinol oxidase subunit 1